MNFLKIYEKIEITRPQPKNPKLKTARKKITYGIGRLQKKFPVVLVKLKADNLHIQATRYFYWFFKDKREKDTSIHQNREKGHFCFRAKYKVTSVSKKTVLSRSVFYFRNAVLNRDKVTSVYQITISFNWVETQQFLIPLSVSELLDIFLGSLFHDFHFFSSIKNKRPELIDCHLYFF